MKIMFSFTLSGQRRVKAQTLQYFPGVTGALETAVNKL